MDACYEAWTREHCYRVYASDALSVIAKANGYTIGLRYIDLFSDNPPAEEKSADEIIADIITRGGLEVKP